MTAQRAKKGTSKKKGAPSRASSTCRAVVLVDSQPLRKKIWRQYQTALKKFEKYSADLQRFKNTDSEQYRLWYEGEFSREVIQLRKSRAAIEELTEWMEQVETYAEYRDISLAEALRTLKEAKTEGRLDELWEDLVKEIEDAEERESLEDEDLDKWRKFEEEFDDLFEDAADEYFEREGGRSVDERRVGSRDESGEKTLRSLYHQLALRLHPDTNPDQSPEHKRLFLSMQEAYRNRDIEALEEVWKALEGKAEGPFSWKTADVSEIIKRKKSLDQRSRDLGMELKYAKSHPAWDFSKTLKNKSTLSLLKQKVRHALKQEQAEFDAIWFELNEQIQHVERQSQRAGKRRTKVKSKK